jgi:CTP synthase
MWIRVRSIYEHGECFVTEDGAETDLDCTQERHLNIFTSQANNVTTGRIAKR